MIHFASKPGWIWLVVAAGVVLLLGWSCRRAAGQKARWVVFGLRLLVMVVVALCLLDPRRVREARRIHNTQVAVLLDTSRSMGVTESGRTRIETAKAWVRDSFGVPRDFEVSLFWFDGKLEALPSLEAVTVAGDRTDIGGALEALHRVPSTEPFASVVLISDGADNVSRNLEEIATRFGREHVPLHTLCVGTSKESPAIRIESVETRPVYTRQATIHVLASIGARGLGGTQTEVRVLQDEKVISSQPITLKDNIQKIDLQFAALRDGFQTFALEIPADTREQQPGTHRREFGLNVSDAKIRVLYMEATGEEDDHPEILDLKWALEDEGFEVCALYHEQFKPTPPGLRDTPAYVDPRNGEKIYRVAHSRLGFPKTLEGLLHFDVVICSDIDRGMFTRDQLQNTVKFVEEFGGGFVMVGGVTAFGAGHWNDTPWEKIIPVEMQLEHDTAFDLFRPRIPPESENHPLLKLADEAGENRRIWTECFPHLGGFNRVDRAKPGAATLLVHPTLTTRYGPSVILAAQEIGKGRSMAFTTDTTSKWGYEFEKYWGEPDAKRKPAPGLPGMFPPRASASDNRYYRRFWANAIRWLAANKIAREQASVQISLDRYETLPGQAVAGTAKVFDKTGAPVTGAQVTFSLLQDDKELLAVTATPDPIAAAYCASLAPPAPGRFLVRARARISDQLEAEGRQLLLCQDRDMELSDTSARPELMAMIARNSGGQVLSLGPHSPRLSAVLAGKQSLTKNYQYEPLWDTWPYLATIVGLLTLDWIVRRRNGLA